MVRSDLQRGRVNQKRRTRAALVTAATALLEAGKAPSVAEVADAALVSRATAYRYFPNHDLLLLEAVLEPRDAALLTEALAPVAESEDVAARVDALTRAMHAMVATRETSFRTLLRLLLEQRPADGRDDGRGDGGQRQGRRLRWIEEALRPIHGRLTPEGYRRLVAALALCMGIESYVTLRDVCALSPAEAEAVTRWAAQTLLAGALAGEGVDGTTHGERDR
jgi:AcrR family transcriptional regulator